MLKKSLSRGSECAKKTGKINPTPALLTEDIGGEFKDKASLTRLKGQ
jgi:hypothetical protein